MSDPDLLLSDLWAADEPPVRDPGFTIAVMEKVQRRRTALGLLSLTVFTVAMSAVLWALGPVIRQGFAPVLANMGARGLAEIAGALIMALFLWAWASERLVPLTV
jgi:hypothetical protein